MRQQTNKKYPWIGNDEQDLFLAFLMLKTPDEVRDFLIDLLSPREIKDFAKRWRVAEDLLDGTKQVDVVLNRDASKNTVSRVKRTMVDYGSGMCRTIYDRLKDMGPNEFERLE